MSDPLSPEEEAQEQRLAVAKDDLRAAMQRLPFDIQTAGSVRVTAWKLLHARAQHLLNRNPREPSQYEDLAAKLRGCGEGKVERLAELVFKKVE